MADIEKYIVTGKNLPEWLNSVTNKGIARVVFDEDGNFKHIQMELPTGRKFAKLNDVILKTRSGFVVLTGEQAQKYRVVPKRVEKVIKEEKANVEQVEE